MFLLRIEKEEELDERTSGIQRLDLILCVWLDSDVGETRHGMKDGKENVTS